MDEKQYLNVPDAAAALGISPGTLRAQMFKGRLRYTQVFGKKVIHKTDVEEYRQRTQPDGRPQTGRPRKAAV